MLRNNKRDVFTTDVYKFILVGAVLMALVSLAGCGTSKKQDEDTMPDTPVEQLYNDAADALDAGKGRAAVKGFDEVERQHPYSPWATKAELMSAYASYRAQDYDVALVGLDRFIRLNPGYKDIDYAYYLKGLCYYEQVTDIKRDQQMTMSALEAFDGLVNLFPESTYARDARLKRDMLRDHLAGKEMEVGRYYLKRDMYPAAIKRFQVVIKDYQTTTHAPEALHRLVEAYLRIGLPNEALRVAAVLGYNYPGSVWYEDSYRLLRPEDQARLDADKKGKKGLWGRTVGSLF